MARVEFTRHLVRFFGDLEAAQDVDGGSVAEIVAALEVRHPGLAGYLIDERGSLRQHVNIFVGDRPVRDRVALSDPVGPTERIFVLQALSGGSPA
jgi:molybdopterin synthase sulfur carrier subunit